MCNGGFINIIFLNVYFRSCNSQVLSRSIITNISRFKTILEIHVKYKRIQQFSILGATLTCLVS